MGNNIEKSLEDFEGVKASISDYGDDEFDFEFIKVKGTPIFIQNNAWFWENIDESYSFFLSINEEGYIDGLVDILCFGAIYLYQHKETKEIVAGFWQCS